MTFAATWTDVTRHTARLLAAGPATGVSELHGRDLDDTLAARDAFVGGLRGVTAVLARASHQQEQLTAQAVVDDPGRALNTALRALRKAGPESVSPSEALSRGSGEWAALGRAAAALEPHHDRLHRMPEPWRRAALRDVADVALALHDLDGDLAKRIPESHDQLCAQLQDSAAHGLVRLAAGELRHQLSLADHGQCHPEQVHERVRVVVLRSPDELPEGLRRLTAVVEGVGTHIAAVDLRAVARLLAETTEAAARAGALDPANATTALSGLRGVVVSNVATLSRPDPRIRMQGTEIVQQLRRLTASAAPSVLSACIPELGRTSHAMSLALRSAGQAGRLLTRPGEHAVVSRTNLLWVPVAQKQLPHLPAVANLDSVDNVLGCTRPELVATAALATSNKEPPQARFDLAQALAARAGSLSAPGSGRLASTHRPSQQPGPHHRRVR